MNQALALLVFVWAGLLIPVAVRRSRTSPHATVGGFERAMDVLRSQPLGIVPDGARHAAGVASPRGLDAAPAGPGLSPARRDGAVIARRRAWFVRGLAATAVSLPTAVLLGGWLWLLCAGTVVTFAGYVVVLRRQKLQRDDARRVVHELEAVGDTDAVFPPVAVGGGAASTVRLRRWDG